MIQKFHYKSYTRQTVLLVPSFKTKQPCILNKRNFECTIQTFHVLAQFQINTTYQLYPIHLIIHSFCYIFLQTYERNVSLYKSCQTHIPPPTIKGATTTYMRFIDARRHYETYSGRRDCTVSLARYIVIPRWYLTYVTTLKILFLQYL